MSRPGRTFTSKLGVNPVMATPKTRVCTDHLLARWTWGTRHWRSSGPAARRISSCTRSSTRAPSRALTCPSGRFGYRVQQSKSTLWKPGKIPTTSASAPGRWSSRPSRGMRRSGGDCASRTPCCRAVGSLQSCPEWAQRPASTSQARRSWTSSGTRTRPCAGRTPRSRASRAAGSERQCWTSRYASSWCRSTTTFWACGASSARPPSKTSTRSSESNSVPACSCRLHRAAMP
mmetsp:Transcript_7450/g.27328  ORF Transcript_7450/g.27328 Transcript_7450/m.27328 type:complete len:232 (-) Transcript_7450:252-947(-)